MNKAEGRRWAGRNNIGQTSERGGRRSDLRSYAEQVLIRRDKAQSPMLNAATIEAGTWSQTRDNETITTHWKRKIRDGLGIHDLHFPQSSSTAACHAEGHNWLTRF